MVRSPRRGRSIACAAAVLGCEAVFGATAQKALAQVGERCERAKVEVTPGLDAAWQAEIAAVCARLADLPDRDPDARISVARHPEGGARLEVRLADGRTAERQVMRREDLREVMEALVRLPPTTSDTPPPPPPVTEPPAKPAAATPPKPASTPSTAVLPPAAPSTPGSPIDFDVAALVATRLLGSPATLGIGAVLSGDVDVDAWIFGGRIRLDSVLMTFNREAHIDATGIGAGVEAARRFDLGVFALDAGLGVDALAEVPLRGDAKPGKTERERDADDVRGDVRIRTFGRAWFPGKGVSFVGLVGLELSPPRLARESGPGFGGELGVGIGWAGL